MNKGSKSNRSTGTPADYLSLLLRGKKPEEIGDAFGITGSAVRKALAAAGLPTSAAKALGMLPEGCTPTDANVLRAANLRLSTEVFQLRGRLRAARKALGEEEPEA